MMTDHNAKASELFDLSGKTAIVTGAAQGIGRAVAEGLASVGVSVVLADILEDGLRESEGVITERYQKCAPVVVDLSQPEERIALVKRAVDAFGQVDILVNCAGVTRSASSEDYSAEDWNLTLEVNLTAMFHLCQLTAQDMIPRRSGVIINISSIGGALGFPNNPAYQASKGGVRQLTRALATDWAKYNIRVNNICPGYMKTDMTIKGYNDPQVRAARSSRNMLNRWGEPEEILGPVIFLASEASSYVTGNDLFVDGGWARSGLTE